MHSELTNHQEVSQKNLERKRSKDLSIPNLKFLSNGELNSQLQSLVRQEREVLSDILYHIVEVDRRRLYLEMAFPNLFSLLTEHLGYSNGSAQRRIDAARLLNDVPTLNEKLESGNINLAQVSLMQKAIRQKKKESKACLSKPEKQELLERLSGQSFEATQQIVAQTLDLEIQQAPQIRHQKDNSVRLEVTFSQQQWQKLQHMRELLSNSLPHGSWDQVLEYLADKVITQKTKSTKPRNNPSAKTQGKSQLRIPKQSTLKNTLHQPPQNQHPTNILEKNSQPPAFTSKQSSQNQLPTNMLGKNSLPQSSSRSSDRPVPAAIKRQVLQKDLCCQYTNPVSGKKCAAKWNLHVDHIQPRWAGGSNDPQNLRVLCQQHNQYIYKQQAGLRAF